MRLAGQQSLISPTVVLIGGVTVIGLALRLALFGNSLWGDELSTNFVVHGFGVGDVLDVVGSDKEGTPPLFFLLTRVTKGLDGVEGLRIVSLLAGLATIALTYLLGIRTVGRSGATVGCALVALSPIQIFYATEARAYALVTFFTLCAALAAVLALGSDRQRWWWVYGLSSAAAVYTHYTAVFVLIGLAGWALVTQRQASRAVVLANLGAAALFLPWLPEFLEDSREAPAAKTIEAINPLTFANVRRDLLSSVFGSGVAPAGEVPGRLVVSVIGTGLAIGALGVLLKIRTELQERWWPPRAEVVLVLILALAAPVGAAFQGIVDSSQFFPRNLLTSWPGYALLVGGLATAGRNPFRLVAISLVLVGYAIGAAKMLDSENQRPDFAGAADFIVKSGDPNSPVVEFPQPAPGPQTALEAALAPTGEPLPPGRPILDLALPPFSIRLRAQAPGPPGILDPLPIPTEAQVAHRAARLARAGPLFLVTPGGASIEDPRALPPVASFLNALPPRFHHTESRTFPGFTGLNVTVHVLASRRVGMEGRQS